MTIHYYIGKSGNIQRVQRERGRERKKERERERKKERDREREA